ncbi:MAG: class I mannose-6-phosphate isomerase [Planctomycetia bacterium]|nr:class I mannose-6-phosphate isomerase [Planctomycetia bacterium]
MMSPLRLQPLIKQRPWGGRQLTQLWHASDQRDQTGNSEGWAESWEVVDLGDDQSQIIGGEFAGRSLGDLVREHGVELLGEQSALKQFPLLFKFLDAAELLSVQVHPNDEQAMQLGVGQHGKSEAWVIIAAEPGSQLLVGLKPEIDQARFEQHLAAGTVVECLNTFPARVGDVISVPAGTVHAIGGGVALAEIQQPSDVTFRLFDWNRLDASGQTRTLHIAEAMQCIDFSREPEKPLSPRWLDPQLFAATTLQANGSTRHEELIRSEHFLWQRHQLARASFKLTECGRCRIVSLIAGAAELSSLNGRELLLPGNTLLIPAHCGTVEVTSTSEGLLLEALDDSV